METRERLNGKTKQRKNVLCPILNTTVIVQLFQEKVYRATANLKSQCSGGCCRTESSRLVRV